VEDTFTRSSVIDENERRIYEVDEKPEDRPRRQSKMPGKYSNFVMNSVKNRRIKSEVARTLSRVMPLNGKIALKMIRLTSKLHNKQKQRKRGQQDIKNCIRNTKSGVRISRQKRIEINQSAGTRPARLNQSASTRTHRASSAESARRPPKRYKYK